MPLPNILEFIGSNVTQAGFKVAQEKLLNYLGLEVATKAEINNLNSTLNISLANFANGASKFYPTLAEANADISNIMPKISTDTVRDKVDIGEVANGGIWYKEAYNSTSLTKSPHDSVLHAAGYTDNKVQETVSDYVLGESLIKSISYTITDGAVPNTDPSQSAILATGAGRQYVKIDVSMYSHIKAVGSKGLALWVWVFEKLGGAKVVSTIYGDMETPVPDGAVFAYRAMKTNTNTENNIVITGKLKIQPVIPTINQLKSDISNLLEGEWQGSVVQYSPIAGYAVDTDSSSTNIFSPANASRAYIKIDVSALKALKATGSVTSTTAWVWVLVSESGVKTVTAVRYDELLEIPEGTKWAYRTFKTENYTENADLELTGYTNETLVAYFERSFQTLHEKIFDESADIVAVPYNVTNGAAANNNLAENSPIAAGTGRAYTKIDVSNFESITVEGSINRPGWVWVFIHEDGSKTAPANYNSDGTFIVPETAIWAYRTINNGAGVIENADMQITAKLKFKSLQVRVKYLGDAVKDFDEKLASIESGSETELLKAMLSGNVLKISDFSGATQHDQIENAINFIKKRGWGILDMEYGVWVRNSAVILPDNCWIYLNKATVKLANGVFDNIFRNEGIVVNPDPFGVALELNENRNIRIFGKSIEASVVSGPDIPYTAPHPIDGGAAIPWVGDFYGWRTIPILFANVKDYKLHDFAMSKTTCWAISQEHGCENFEVFNIKFDTTVKNGDGVDVRQGCKKGKIYNISGSTSDDMVALSAVRKFGRVYPDGNYIYPGQVGGYADRGFGDDITDIQISNISGKGQHHGVRLLASGGSKVGNISVDNVSDNGGSFANGIVLVSSGYGTPASMGDLFNITVNGIESNQSQTPLKLSGPIKDSSFNKIRQHKQTGVLYENTATFENTEITNAEFIV